MNMSKSEQQYKNNYIQRLEWDSNFFNLNCGKVNLPNVINYKYIQTLKESFQNFDFVVLVDESSSTSNASLLAKYTTAFFVEFNMQLKFDDYYITRKSTCKREMVLTKDCKVISEVQEMTSFDHSRFVRDVNLSNLQGGTIHGLLIESKLKKGNSFLSVCLAKNKIVQGYILYTENSQNWIIDLISVKNEFKGNGIGTSLILGMINNVSKLNQKPILVGTQATNTKALNFYNKLGFAFHKNRTIYHWWKTNEFKESKE